MKHVQPALPLLALLLVAAPAPGAAQEPKDTFQLRELVVTATRSPAPRAALPLATTVVTGEQLRARSVRTVGDALRDLPGVTVVAPGAYGGVTSLFMRGGNSGYVKVLVDGVPVNSPGGTYDFASLSADAVERIEIVRGPGSVLYGSDAVTGVVQIFTRAGAGSPRAEAALAGGRGARVPAPTSVPAAPGAPTAAGGYGISELSGSARGGAGKAGWSLAASRFASDGLYALNNGDLDTNVSGRFDVRPDTRSELALTARRTGADFHFPTDGGGNIADANTATRTSVWVLGLQAGRRLGAVEAHLLLGGDDAHRADLDPPDDAADTLGFYASDAHTHDTRRTADLHFDWHAPAASVLTAGASWEREHEHGTSSYRSQFGDDSDATDVGRTTRGAYLQLFSAPVTGLSLTAGGRVDDNTRFGQSNTYRVGVAYRLPTGTRLRAAAGTAFKEPTFFENFAHGFVTGNPALRPERSASRELGVAQVLAGNRLSLEATWFGQQFRDLVQYLAQAATPGGPNYVNLGAARANGIELALGADPGAGLHLDAQYTYVRTLVTDEGAGGDPSFAAGQRLLRRPTHSAALSAGWRRGAAAAGATLAYVGARDDIDYSDPDAYPAPRKQISPYARLDLSGQAPLLHLRAGRSSLAATLRVENALNRSYREIANFPARGRTIFLGARMGLGE